MNSHFKRGRARHLAQPLYQKKGDSMEKIAVAGAGAMGGRIGTMIKQAGYDVTLIDYWDEHVAQIQQHEVEIQTEDDTYQLDIKAIHPHEIDTQYDLIIILTKAMQSVEMLQDLKRYDAIKPDTAVLTMMNGLGHHERFSQVIPMSQIFLAVTVWTAGLRGPGQLLLEGTGGIGLQRADGEADARTSAINDIFNDAGLNSTISEDVFQSVWSKATLNSVVNPLCTILNKRIGAFAEYEATLDMIKPIIKEIVAVAAARDVQLSEDALIDKIEATYPEETQGLHYPSMHQDLYSGRYTEVDYLNGQIAKYGDELGIETPNNKLLTHLVHQLELSHVD